MLTLEDPDAPAGLRFHRRPRPPASLLRFVDLDSPTPATYASMLIFRMADRADIEQALQFAQQQDELPALARSALHGLAAQYRAVSGEIERLEGQILS